MCLSKQCGPNVHLFELEFYGLVNIVKVVRCQTGKLVYTHFSWADLVP